MSNVTISLPDAIITTIESRANAMGFRSKEEYLLALVQADCERAEIEPVLEARVEGPFEPLEADCGAPYPKRNRKLQGLRMLAVIGFQNYLVFYRTDAESIRILFVTHGARHLLRLFRRESRE